MMNNDSAIEAAAEWWANRLLVKGKTQPFKDALVEIIRDEWLKEKAYCAAHPYRSAEVKISVDYDPCPLLLGALEKIGVSCRGTFFSADGIFDGKTASTVGAGWFAVRGGRGAPWEDVFGVSGRSSA